MRGTSIRLGAFVVAALVASAGTASAAAPRTCTNAYAPMTGTSPSAAFVDPIVGALEATDATHKGRFDVPAPGTPPATCGSPKPAPAVLEAGTDFRHKAYTFKNRSRTASCVSVTAYFTSAGGGEGVGYHQTAAYLGSYDPTDIRKNHLADAEEQSAGPDAQHFETSVPALAEFVVVISSSGPWTPGYEPAYQLYVGGCGRVVVTGVAPSSGPTGGGTAVTVQGSGFSTGAPTVTFGSAAAASVVAVDDETLTVTTPPGPAGAVDVVVANGTEAEASSSLPGAFTYADATTGSPGPDAGGGSGGGEGGTPDGGGGGTDGGSDAGAGSGTGTGGGASSGGAGATPDDEDGDGASTSGGCTTAPAASGFPAVAAIAAALTVLARKRRRG